MEPSTPPRPTVVERQGLFAERDDWAVAKWCRIETALELIGTRSAMVLLREALYGATRFEDLVRRTGLSEAVAAGRLKELVRHGMLERQPYKEPGARTRYEYLVTDLGRKVFPVVVALMEFGELVREDHATGAEFVHRECGGALTTSVRCTQGHEVDLGDAAVRIKDEDLALRSLRAAE